MLLPAEGKVLFLKGSELLLDAAKEELLQGFGGIHAFEEDLMHRFCDGHLHPQGVGLGDDGLHGMVAFGQMLEGFLSHEGFTEASVVAVFGEHRGLVVPQMAEAVGGEGAAALGFDELCHFPGASGHEGTFEGGESQGIQHPCGDAHHVLQGRPQLVSDEVRADVEADEAAGEAVHQFLLEVSVLGVDDHAVGDVVVELLDVAGAQPHGTAVGGGEMLHHHLGEAFPCSDLHALHAEKEGPALKLQRGELLHESPEILGGNGDDDEVALLEFGEVGGEPDGLRKGQVAVEPVFLKGFEAAGLRSSIKGDGKVHFVQVPGDEAAPASGADDGCFHGLSSLS